MIDSRTNSNELIDRDSVQEIVHESGLDLVFVNAPEGAPPVYRLVDYNKFLFEKQKAEKAKQRQQRLSARTSKELQFRQQISEHDYQTKLNQLIGWLPNHDVWIELKLDRKSRPGLPRGVPLRELARWNDFILNKVVRDLEGKVQVGPSSVGDRLIKIMIRPL